MRKEVENVKYHKINKPCVPAEEFMKYYLEHSYNENMFNKNGSINYNYWIYVNFLDTFFRTNFFHCI